MDIGEIDDLALRKHEEVDALFARKKEIESVTKDLQSETTNLSDQHAFFDTVIIHQPVTAHRFKSGADIVIDFNFDGTIRKIQNDQSNSLTDKEKRLVTCLVCEQTV